MNKRLPSLFVCVLALTSCTTLQDAIFERPSKLAPVQSAVLGGTTRDEIIQQLGLPQEINQRRFDNVDSEVFFYFEESVSDDPAQRFGYKSLACEFKRGVLTGYAFRESLDARSRSLQELESGKLAKGRTTRREVQTLLGIPDGKALLPTTIHLAALGLRVGGASFPLASIPAETQEVWWYYSQNFDDASNKGSQESLSIFFDRSGIFVGSTFLREWVSISR